MKIVLFNTLYFPYTVGGAERSTQILAESLVKKGYDVVVITTGKQDIKRTVHGVTVYYIYVPNVFWRYEADSQNNFKRSLWRLIDYHNIFTIPKVNKILLEEKPDICHTNNIGGFSVSLWTTIKKLNLPLVHTIRDYYTICATSKMLKKDKSCNNQCIKCKLYTYNKKLISHRVDAVVGVSKFILNKHLECGYFKNAKIKTYIYNPIEKINENFIKEKSDNIRFGYLGLISPIKGVEQLLETFIQIKSKNTKLYLAGKEHYKGYINFLKNKYKDKRIKFIGFVKPEKFFRQVDVLIHPTLWSEPFGRALIEAYSYKTPVVASKKGGVIEVVIHGKTGYLFTRINELKNYIENFINNPSIITVMQNKCLEISKKFLVDNIIEDYIEVYKELV